MAGPLTGITIIEFAGLGPGPFCGMMFADMGANVIRIDRVAGSNNEQADIFKRNDPVIDRGRRSICLDLKNPTGKEVALRLVARADALFEGFRPGVMEKLGLDPATCMAHNARLIYGRMTGWGQTGPLAHVAGHDINYISLSGALHAMGPSDRPPPVPLNLIGDFAGGGMLLAFGILCALFEARSSGKGQVVDAAMSDGAATLMAMMYGLYSRGLWDNARASNFLDGAAPFYGTYECSDGKYVSIGPLEPQFYREMLRLCGIQDPQFLNQWSLEDWPRMRNELERVFKTRSRDEWCAIFEGSDACLTPVLDLEEAPRHPHNAARKTFIEVNGKFQPAPAPRFSRTPGAVPQPSSDVAAQTIELLRWGGYSESEAGDLIKSGVVQ